MNRNRAKELLPIIQAFADGRELQFRRTPKNCREAEIWSNDAALTPNYDFHDDYEYRIKPKELWVMVYNNCFSSSYETEENVTSYMQTMQKNNPVMFDDAYVIKVREICDD